MQRTPRSASARDKKQETPRNKKLANAAIIGAGALLVAGLGVAFVQDERAEARYAEASSSYTAPAADISRPVAKNTTTLFIGDSYSTGGGADSGQDRWTAHAARSLGWKEVNIAAGGTGYGTAVEGDRADDACGRDYCPTYLEALSDYDGAKPSTVVVAGGRNDRNMDRDAFKSAVDAVLEEVRERFPDAKVYVINPVWDDDDVPSDVESMIDTVQAAAKDVGAISVDIGQPLVGEPDLVAADGVHPNSEGHTALADAFVESID